MTSLTVPSLRITASTTTVPSMPRGLRDRRVARLDLLDQRRDPGRVTRGSGPCPAPSAGDGGAVDVDGGGGGGGAVIGSGSSGVGSGRGTFFVTGSGWLRRRLWRRRRRPQELDLHRLFLRRIHAYRIGPPVRHLRDENRRVQHERRRERSRDDPALRRVALQPALGLIELEPSRSASARGEAGGRSPGKGMPPLFQLPQSVHLQLGARRDHQVLHADLAQLVEDVRHRLIGRVERRLQDDGLRRVSLQLRVRCSP